MNRSSLFPVQVTLGALLLTLGVLGGRLAQGTRERFFPETGQTVREPFLSFFEAHGGLNFFGYPITPAIPEPPYQIQCFQNACLRWDPLAPSDQAVQPLPVAEAMGLGSPPIPPQQIPMGRPFRRYIPETGHTVSGMFLAFWLRHGGAKLIGNPITEPYVENGRPVQVFQRMKLIWDPTEQAVRPMGLGESYARTRGLNPRVPPRILQTSSALQVRIAMRRPVLAVGDLQTILVFVTDEENQPVPRARVRIHIPGHDPLLLETDEAGLAEGNFIVRALPSGSLVEVHVTASDGLRQAEAFSSFRIWP
ncbi:carboxypeptidase-like regulatory domain-containing protein [Thermoflexus sp.]|uniref:carboxypeptidase-like regulatory domain-containing protein n=1 Tax=Thermoflexus sp. TaxID=1969742 RepID=UPI002ADD868A|nr:carboxypeptidase-like regulatory domain-containing protein [Thermoflexus sp.]